MTKISLQITKARSALILDHVFFASLALRLDAQESKLTATMATDGVDLLYNPDFINKLTLPELTFVIAHEVMHCAMCHHTRRNSRDGLKWNMACDYAINIILIDSGFTVPNGALVEHSYKGMAAEQIYNQLPDLKQPQGGKGQGQTQPQQGQPWNIGEIRDAKSDSGKTLSEAEKKAFEETWKIATAQAQQQAQQAGNMPAGVKRAISKILAPKLNWREILRRFIQTSSKNDFSWCPPNRRYIHSGLYLPSMTGENIDDIVIAVDTSGSIDRELLNQFSSEVSAILQAYTTTVTVIYCDTKIGGTETFTTYDLPVTLTPKGGGGTSFKPPFKYVADEQIRPTCLIYLTDLDCSDYPTVPEYPVLWINMSGSKPYYGNPPFGEVVDLKHRTDD